MKRLQLTDIAQADLKSIRRYSQRTWGSERTERYITALRDTMKGLVAGSILTRERDDPRPGLHMAVSGRHCIFFEENPSRILVVRVLHDRMDFPRHLPAERTETSSDQ